MPTIMLVDDEELSRFAMRTLLLRNFGDVTVIAEAESGEEAVELYKKYRPDGVIMDIRIPGINGLEASRRILESYPRASILICSAYDSFSLVSEALEIGVKGYLLKPIKREVAVERIKKLFHLRLSAVELFADQQLISILLRNSTNPGKIHQIERAYGSVVQGMLLATYVPDVPEADLQRLAYALKKRSSTISRVFTGRMDNIFVAIVTPATDADLWKKNMEDAVSETGLKNDVHVLAVNNGDWSQKWTELQWEFTLMNANKQGLGILDNIDCYIHDEMLAELSLDRLASSMGVSAQYLSGIFKEKVGMNFIEYITKRRMDYAAKLLVENNLNTQETARECGYSDLSYFRKLFSRTFGMTPHDYRVAKRGGGE